jgi:hypothetical protein
MALRHSSCDPKLPHGLRHTKDQKNTEASPNLGQNEFDHHKTLCGQTEPDSHATTTQPVGVDSYTQDTDTDHERVNRGKSSHLDWLIAPDISAGRDPLEFVDMDNELRKLQKR